VALNALVDSFLSQSESVGLKGLKVFRLLSHVTFLYFYLFLKNAVNFSVLYDNCFGLSCRVSAISSIFCQAVLCSSNK